jgi:acyl-CoA reductase-like NAD-dependent aldehyde dehydrogenase
MNTPFSSETTRCRAAQNSWRKLPVRERLRHVRRLRHLLADAAEELAQTVAHDIGRSADEVFGTDILPSADACRFLERQAARLLRPRRVPTSQRPLWLFGSRDTVHRRPHGVVGIIGTWNYPILLNAVPVAQALTAGNGVLWKPSEMMPAVAAVLHRLFVEAGFPPDLFVSLPATREAGQELVEANIDHVVFTGSAEVGRKLARRLGERLISSTLELSGCDPMIVGADADIDMAAKAAWYGVSLNQGQTCIAVRRMLVERAIYPAFLERLRSLAGHTQNQSLMQWPQAQHAESLVREAIELGAALLQPGETPRAENGPPRYPPTVVVDARADMAICREASFAPIAAVIPIDDLDEAIRQKSQCPFALGASIFMRDRTRAAALAQSLGAGMVTINDVIAQTAHPATPFGGRQSSGWGVTQGAEGLLALTVAQVISERKGAFRPHYAVGEIRKRATTALLKGLLRWRHSRRWRQRWSGFWKTIGAALRFPLKDIE